MSVMTYLLNLIFVTIGENVVTAYGLYYKIQQFVLFAAFGLRDAITPVLSFNYGMKDKSRENESIKYGLLYTIVIMVIGFILLELLAEPFSELFGLSGETQQLCIYAMRIISISFVFAGTNIAFQGIFQALDSGIESLIISVLRQLAFIIPIAFIFTQLVLNHICSDWTVWFSFIISEFLSAVIALLFFKRVYRRKIIDTVLDPIYK